MKKIVSMILAGGCLMQVAQAQSTEKKIATAIQHPSREEQSAKADVLLIDKTKIFDSSAINRKNLIASSKKYKKNKK